MGGCIVLTYMHVLHVNLPDYLSTYFFIYPSVHLSICPRPVQRLIDLQVCFHLSMYRFIDLSIHVSICPLMSPDVLPAYPRV